MDPFQDLFTTGLQELGLPGIGSLALLVALVGVIASGVTAAFKRSLRGFKLSNRTYDAILGLAPILLSMGIMAGIFPAIGAGVGWGLLWGCLAGVLSSSVYAKVKMLISSPQQGGDA